VFRKPVIQIYSPQPFSSLLKGLFDDHAYDNLFFEQKHYDKKVFSRHGGYAEIRGNIQRLDFVEILRLTKRDISFSCIKQNYHLQNDKR
jgi:hypothetical protein